MKTFVTIGLLIMFSHSLLGQDLFTSNNNGAWSNFFIWDGPLFQVPGANDTAHILAMDTVNLTDNRSCYDLDIIGCLDKTNNDTLTVLNNLNLTNIGGLVIEDGVTIVNGDFYYDGTIESTSLNTGYIEVTGDVQKAGIVRLQTNSGSIRIYSGLDLP